MIRKSGNGLNDYAPEKSQGAALHKIYAPMRPPRVIISVRYFPAALRSAALMRSCQPGPSS